MAKSEVWRQRRFGNEVLWNGSYDDAGNSFGGVTERRSRPDDRHLLYDSIRRFNGLDREVIVLVELIERARVSPS